MPDTYDSEKDSDSDGISDLEETSKYYTDPFSDDSDSDGLNDYDEIFTYKTNPLNKDTDEDTLDDKFEIEHNLDPNNKTTDGIHLDSELTFEQTISNDNISSDLTSDDNPAVPSLFGNAKGNLSDNVYISETIDMIISENRSLVGKAIDVNADDYDVNGLKLSFDIEKYQDANGDTETLSICKTNEDGELEIVESTQSGTEITCTLDSDGTYCVVNVDELLAQLGIDIDNIAGDKDVYSVGANANSEEVGGSVSGQADIVFAIDTTGSMEEEIDGVEKNVTYFAEKLKSEYNVMVNYALIDYKDLEEDGDGTTKIIKNGISNWFSDTTKFSEKVNLMYADGGGDDPECSVDALETARRLNFRSGSHKFVILITDAEYKVLNRYGISSLEEEADLLKEDGIVTSVVTSSWLKSTYQTLMNSTNGIYADIDTDFGDVLLQLADMIGETTSSDNWVIMKHGYTYIEMPQESDGDYDDDGLSDEYELGTKETIDLTPFIKFSLAIHGVPFDKYLGKTSIDVYNSYSNPLKYDTDNDGISDKDDTAPWRKGLADGIVGKLSLVSCYNSEDAGWTSGHVFFVYTSYINDSVDFSKLAAGWSKINTDETWSWDNLKYDETLLSEYQFKAGESATIGNGAFGAGWFGSGDSSGSSGTDSSKSGTGEENGVCYNMEVYKLFSPDFGYSYLNNTYISEDITSAKLEQLVAYCSKPTVCYWSLKHNCAEVACKAWNLISDVEVNPYNGGFLLGTVATPKGLKENLRKLTNHYENFALAEALA